METKFVVATKQGFYNDSLVKPGETISVPVNAKASWFVDAPPKAAQPKGKGKGNKEESADDLT